MNVTVPVALEGDTVAVSVTLWPNNEELGDVARKVEVPTGEVILKANEFEGPDELLTAR
jgi:hypothetical protein